MQNVLQNYVLPNSSNALNDRITQVNVQGEILQITINTYPEEKEQLQQIHDELADALEKCGIKELNLHVIQQKTGHKKEGGCGHHHAEGESCSSQPQTAASKSNLPPVVDASGHAAQAEADPNNPPIQKAAPATRCTQTSAYSECHSGLFRQGRCGKSTTTVNLALALQNGLNGPDDARQCRQNPDDRSRAVCPTRCVWYGSTVDWPLTGDNNTPVAWRGPKATGALMQLFNQTLWRSGCIDDRHATRYR